MSLSLRRPLPGGVQNTEYAHQIAGHVIDQDVIRVRNQLTGAGHAAQSTEVGMVDQAIGPH